MVGEPLGNDAHYLVTTAQLFGWRVDRQPDGSVWMRYGAWTVQANFSGHGAFCSGQASGPHTSRQQLRMPEVISILEQHGSSADAAS